MGKRQEKKLTSEVSKEYIPTVSHNYSLGGHSSVNFHHLIFPHLNLLLFLQMLSFAQWIEELKINYKRMIQNGSPFH